MHRFTSLIITLVAVGCGVEPATMRPTPPAPVSPVPKPDPTDPTDPTVTTVTVDLQGALLRCISEPLDHTGSRYQFDLRPDSGLADLTIDFAPVPSGRQVDTATAAAAERVFEASLPLSAADFVGFESGDTWLVLDTALERGFAQARLGRLDRARETLLPAEREDIAATCFSREVEMPARYDPATGACTNDAGEIVFNLVPLRFIMATGLGQCAKIDERINESAFGYPIYRGIDLRGADLDGAELSFASIHQARLDGANLEGFSFGYALVDGSIDAHTRLPTQMFCQEPVTDDHFRCSQ